METVHLPAIKLQLSVISYREVSLLLKYSL